MMAPTSAALLLLAATTVGGVTHPRTTNVTYDARSLLFNGERKLWVSGGMHYSRHQPELWAPALQQAKDNGLVGVTSYVKHPRNLPLRAVLFL